jgi:phosphoglucomutase
MNLGVGGKTAVATGSTAEIGLGIATALASKGPSGTENIYKIYAGSFKDQAHLDAIAGEPNRL